MLLGWMMMWALSYAGILSTLCIVVAILLTILACVSRSWRPFLVLFASPFAFCFIMGLMRWFDEEPTFVGFGLPTSQSFNLKQESRCYWRSTGCIVDGSEWVWQTPSNLGLWFMCKTFGWPPHSYHGAYPTKEEAVQLTEASGLVSRDEFLLGKLRFQDREIQLGAGQANRMVVEAGGDYFEPEKMGDLEIRAAFAGDGCILVRLNHKNPIEELDLIYLLDSQTVWPFARYLIKGRESRYSYFASKNRL